MMWRSSTIRCSQDCPSTAPPSDGAAKLLLSGLPISRSRTWASPRSQHHLLISHTVYLPPRDCWTCLLLLTGADPREWPASLAVAPCRADRELDTGTPPKTAFASARAARHMCPG
jgi:hypothetical protein